MKYWTDEEIQILKKEYPINETKDVAKKLNRTISSIRAKAGNLGIKKIQEVKPVSKSLLAKREIKFNTLVSDIKKVCTWNGFSLLSIEVVDKETGETFDR